MGTGNESMENFFPHMNIKTRGDTDQVLMSNVSWRGEPSYSAGPSDPSCCAVNKQECHNDGFYDVGNLCEKVDLSDIVENPDYNSGLLLNVLDSELASGASGEQDLKIPNETVNDRFVASQISDQDHFNFQENDFANTSVVGLDNSSIVHFPVSVADPVYPITVVTESSLVGSTVNLVRKSLSATIPSYTIYDSATSRVLTDVMQVRVESTKHVISGDVNCLPVDHSRLTGSFQQMTLQNGEKLTLESPINAIIGFNTLVVQPTVNPLPNYMSSTDYATQVTIVLYSFFVLASIYRLILLLNFDYFE